MRKAIVSISIFVSIVVALFWLISYLGRLSLVTVKGEVGVNDLSAINLSETVAESSNWRHYPNKLLRPEEIIGSGAGIDEQVSFGTYAMRLIVPEDQTYLVAFNSIEYATLVFINNEQKEEIGSVSSDAEGFKPARKQCYYVVTAEQGAIDIVLQYANFYSDYANVPTVSVGVPELMFREQIHRDFTRFTILAVYLVAFILYAGMYLFNRSRKENFYFSLLCLLLSARECFIEEDFLYMLLGEVSLYTVFTIQFVAIGLVVILFFLFAVTLFPGIIPRKGAIAFLIACNLFLVVSLVTRGSVPYWMLCVFLSIGALMMIYLLTGLAKMYKKMIPSQKISSLGVVLLYAAMFNDMLHQLRLPIGVIGRKGLLQNAMMMFIFIQMTALFIQFVWIERQLGETREKEAALTARNETLRQVDQQRVRFLSDISHELKTPLTVVSNYAQLTYQHNKIKSAPDEYTQEKMLLVTSEAKRMAVMVEQVLDIARIEEGGMNYKWKEVHIESLVRELMEVYYPVLNKNHNQLRVEIQKSLKPVRGDARRLQQVLLNLINNAVRFTKKGVITVTAVQQKDAVEMRIEDTGIGMTAEQAARAFDRYTTGKDADDKRTGTGLGLYIVKTIVQDHQGEIWVESRLGEGSRFIIVLPCSQEGEKDEEENHFIN